MKMLLPSESQIKMALVAGQSASAVGSHIRKGACQFPAGSEGIERRAESRRRFRLHQGYPFLPSDEWVRTCRRHSHQECVYQGGVPLRGPGGETDGKTEDTVKKRRGKEVWIFNAFSIGGDNMLGTALVFVAGYVVGGIVNVSFVIVWCLHKIGKKNGGHA